MEFEKKVVELDVNDVLPNRFQPRIKFNEDSINELSESIKEHGVIQPIVVRKMGDKYEIIAGERRYKATLLSGKQTIPAIITDLNDKDSAEVALIENVQRKDLTPIEEAISYKKILDMGYLTQEELATKLGKNQSTVANKLRLLNLAEEVQEAVLEEKISERHARSLLKLQNQADQIKMLNNIIENRLTVRKADEEISKMLKPEPIVIESEDVFNPFDINSIKNDYNEEGGTSKMNNEFDPFKFEEPVLSNKSEEKETFNLDIPTTPIEDISDSNSNIQSFMDVSKIEKNAQDINRPKPEVNLGSLLTPSIKPIEENEVSPEEDNKKIDLPLNKFFNLPFDDEEESTFDPFARLENTNDKTDKIVDEVQNLKDDSTSYESQKDDFFNFNFDDAVNLNPIVSNANNSQLPNDSESNSLEQKLNTVIPSVENSNDSNDSNDSIDSYYSANNGVQFNTIGEELPVPTLKSPENKNLMEALNIVRSCSKNLEDLGFIIDVEEIDFESMYQIIFKIKK